MEVFVPLGVHHQKCWVPSMLVVPPVHCWHSESFVVAIFSSFRKTLSMRVTEPLSRKANVLLTLICFMEEMYTLDECSFSQLHVSSNIVKIKTLDAPVGSADLKMCLVGVRRLKAIFWWSFVGWMLTTSGNYTVFLFLNVKTGAKQFTPLENAAKLQEVFKLVPRNMERVADKARS